MYNSYFFGENMKIIINNTSMIPIYEQVVSQIKNKIIEGELKENTALPSVRVLAAELRISSLTVKKAYDSLEDEGFVNTVHGKGTYVSPTDRDIAMEARKLEVEKELSTAITRARNIGLSDEEITAMITIIMEDERE